VSECGLVVSGRSGGWVRYLPDWVEERFLLHRDPTIPISYVQNMFSISSRELP
jgi:hypothetical protein